MSARLHSQYHHQTCCEQHASVRVSVCVSVEDDAEPAAMEEEEDMCCWIQQQL